jgi:hypothetical protein
VNAAVNAPLEIEHVWEATTLPDIEQVVSPVKKLVPDTSTVKPTEPDAGLREIDGTVRVVVLV